MSETLRFRVAGVSFRKGLYPGNLWELRSIVEERKAAALRNGVEIDDGFDDFGPEAVAALLIRTPDNPHDANAIEVHVPALGRSGAFIGFVPRDLAELVAPKIDGGAVFDVAVAGIYVDPDHEDRPGCEIVCRPRHPEST